MLIFSPKIRLGIHIKNVLIKIQIIDLKEGCGSGSTLKKEAGSELESI